MSLYSCLKRKLDYKESQIIKINRELEEEYVKRKKREIIHQESNLIRDKHQIQSKYKNKMISHKISLKNKFDHQIKVTIFFFYI